MFTVGEPRRGEVGDHAQDAGCALGELRVERADPPARNHTRHDYRVRHIRQIDSAAYLALPVTLRRPSPRA
jgi:hypothetical protein